MKLKLPLSLKLLMATAIGYGFWGHYEGDWGHKFHKTYSSQETSTKKKLLVEHGKNYFVNMAEYKRASLIRKSSWLWFIVVWVITFSYIMRTQPEYFKLNKQKGFKDLPRN
jgi:hypothetical protein